MEAGNSLVLLKYCPPNETLSINLHRDLGVSKCLMETVSSTFGLVFVLVFGIGQLIFYKKYASPVEHYTLPYSQLFGLQMALNGNIPVLAVGALLVKLLVFKPGIFYGYMLLTVVESVLVWPIVCILILKERRYMLPTPPNRGHGLILLIFWTVVFSLQNLAILNYKNPSWFFKLETHADIFELSMFIFKYACLGGIFWLGLKAPGMPSVRHSDSFARLYIDDEGRHQIEPLEESYSTGSPFRNIFKKVKLLSPFIWPKQFKLQFYACICLLCLLLVRVTNVFVPIYSKKIVDSMTVFGNSSMYIQGQPLVLGSSTVLFRWDLILIYVMLKIIQGGGGFGTGLLNNLRAILWINVEQFTTRKVQVSFFEHLHKLSLRWHMERKTGEVLRAMDRGTDSVNNILSYVIFNIFPTIADIIIAIVYFTAYFNWYFGAIVLITMILYLISTFVVTEWRTKYRRAMNEADNKQKQLAVDSLLNFETVKYYANEKYEKRRYAGAILKYQKEEWKVTASLCALNLVQLIVINIGLLIGSILCVKMVVNHEGLTVGDYVLFASYLMQLYAPLNFFGTYYRMLQRSFIDMENMLDLFKEEEEIVDSPDAEPLNLTNGVIEFRNVSFSYVPEKSVLKNISFVVPSGKSVALVGESGGGKSSIIRLLFRFYEPQSGEILIDGQQINKVTQQSLRKAIGVVPQDTVLFNDTIRNNIKYGNIASDDCEMIEASKASCIHEKILTFPDRYETLVGERGLKLSGGEKQRVAVARTILKNPAVILLDEATSSLDTATERQIQTALKDLCANRTSIIVAHRLSTVIHCDQILVIDGGSIVEGGTHSELMENNGIYSNLWKEQLKTDAEPKENIIDQNQGE